jgi:hypothetical protein
MAKLNQSAPWVTYVSELEQMFKYDRETHVVYNEEANEVKLYVDDPEKASALMELLPKEKVFGNVKLDITVVSLNGSCTINPSIVCYLFNTAFCNNGAFAFTKVISGILSNDITYVVFKNKVVQYFDDNLGDIYGQRSTLYQEIAKDLFKEIDGVFYCTDIEIPGENQSDERRYTSYSPRKGYTSSNAVCDWP